MLRRLSALLILCLYTAILHAQDLSGIEFHGFVTQGFVFSSHNNYLTMQTNSGSAQWTDAAVSVSDSLGEKLRVGIQFHMYQLGEFGGSNVQIDWASGDYRVNDYFGFRAGKVKTVIGLFNDFQDVDAVFLWVLLPQSVYPIDNKATWLANVGGQVYGELPLGNAAGRLHYTAHAGQVTLDANGGYARQFADYGLPVTSPPSGKTYGGDLRWLAPWTGLTIGSSADVQALNGQQLGGNVHVAPYLVGVEYAEFERGKYHFATEYAHAPINPVLTIGSKLLPLPWNAHSWYVMGSYRPGKKIQVGSYYSHYVNKALDTNLPANYSKDWVVSGRYDFNAYFYGKVEGHFLHGTGIGYYASTNPNGLQPNSNLLAAKIGFSF
jgi:hypothetical protein